MKNIILQPKKKPNTIVDKAINTNKKTKKSNNKANKTRRLDMSKINSWINLISIF